ncbi:MAG: hypothetical protein JETCAE03_34180 [Ignavibacteriaceae bacterium]|jgi:hypothetical protein|nr:MAG: hypothetical protein JETCAE03_34180 [Ignavibacteriaceae bacterium]
MSDAEIKTSTIKRLYMQKGKNTIIIFLLIVIAFLLFPYAASLIEGNEQIKMKTLSLDDYEVGQMIETGDFMLWNRKTNEIDYCVKDSLSKVFHFQIMKTEQKNYDAIFDKKKKQ